MAHRKRLIIIGAGGFGREVLQYARDVTARTGEWEIAGFLDRNPDALADFAETMPILGSESDYIPRPEDQFLVGIGDIAVRKRVVQILSDRGARFAKLAHPTAYVSATASVGDGTIIAPFAFLGPYSRIGAHVVLNTYASCGHDSVVDDFCILSPYACINGFVRLGGEVFLGSKAVVLPMKSVGSNSKISAGAVVSRNVPAGSLAAGNPATSRVMFAT